MDCVMAHGGEMHILRLCNLQKDPIDPSLSFPYAGYTVGNTQNRLPLSFKLRLFERAKLMCRSGRV
jgi:hypothetical protein